MKRALIPAFLLLLGSTILGATVMREPLARAATPIASVFVTNDSTRPIPVREQNLDENGNVKVHEQGTASVSVLGTVSTRPQIPPTGFSVEAYNQRLLVGPDPAGTNYAITSVTFSNNSGHLISLASIAGEYGTDCASGSNTFTLGPTVFLPASATIHLDFPQPFVISAKAGNQSCLNLSPAPGFGGDNLAMTVVGYRF